MKEITLFEKSYFVTVNDNEDFYEAKNYNDKTLQGSQYLIIRNDNNSTMKMKWKKKYPTKIFAKNTFSSIEVHS